MELYYFTSRIGRRVCIPVVLSSRNLVPGRLNLEVGISTSRISTQNTIIIHNNTKTTFEHTFAPVRECKLWYCVWPINQKSALRIIGIEFTTGLRSARRFRLPPSTVQPEAPCQWVVPQYVLEYRSNAVRATAMSA